MRHIWLRGVCILGVLLSSGSGRAVAEDSAETHAEESAYEQMELLTEVLLLVRKNYVEELSYEELIEGALKGMLQSLDPHSVFMAEDEYENMKDETQGQYGGIGIRIGLKDGILTIIAPIEDTPGFRAGLQSGDRILEIDGEKAAGVTMRDAVSLLRGEMGEKVILSILAEGASEPHDVEIIREEIRVTSVKGARIVRDGIAYVRITQFAERSTADLHKELEQLKADGMRALVLDLRSNPGGLLREAVRMSETFLKPGSVVVSTRGRTGAVKSLERKAKGVVRYEDIPVAILINSGSASASEIVAGALRDHHRGILVGQTSFGKGSVQNVIPIRSDRKSGLRLTTAYYYTPSGSLIHKIGIDPDVPVFLDRDEWRRVQIRRSHLESPEVFKDADKEEYADVVDRQLERAVDLLQAVMIFKNRR